MNTVFTLKKSGASGNFTKEENLHLTLAFIGETDRDADAKEALKELDSAPFDIRFGGCGCFGDILWAGIDRNPALDKLAQQVQSALRERGFQIEKRKFVPHITLVRRFSAGTLNRPNVPAMQMRVHRVSLMKSERIGGKLVYTEIFGKELA